MVKHKIIFSVTGEIADCAYLPVGGGSERGKFVVDIDCVETVIVA